MKIFLALIAEAAVRCRPIVKAFVWAALLLWASWNLAGGIMSIEYFFKQSGLLDI